MFPFLHVTGLLYSLGLPSVMLQVSVIDFPSVGVPAGSVTLVVGGSVTDRRFTQ